MIYCFTTLHTQQTNIRTKSFVGSSQLLLFHRCWGTFTFLILVDHSQALHIWFCSQLRKVISFGSCGFAFMRNLISYGCCGLAFMFFLSVFCIFGKYSWSFILLTNSIQWIVVTNHGNTQPIYPSQCNTTHWTNNKIKIKTHSLIT